ncbi:MAG: NAD(P)/FAD-dependent oxidoreductase [Anaerolineae bacterium]
MGRITVPQGDEFPRSADMVVIGGGVIGCATAFYASRAGFDTVVLERREGLGTLTTAASEECFRAQFDEPENIRMMQESIAVFEHFAEVIGIPGYDINLHQGGYLFLTASEQGVELLKKRVEHQHQVGLLDVEFLDGDEVRKRFPHVGQNVLAATFRQKDGWLSAHELTHGFAKGSRALFALRTGATGIKLDAHGVAAVLTTRGEIATRCAVIAAGPFAGVVASWVGVQLPLTNLRRQKVVLGDVPLVPRDAPMHIDADMGPYWRPEVDGAALGWALPEEPSEPLDHVPTDWTFPAMVLEGVARLVPFWNQVAEKLTRDKIFLSAGQYTCTPDNKPIIGPCSTIPGLHFNAGYAGHGIMASVGGARLLVDLILNPSANADNPFRYERFATECPQISAERMII